VPKDDNPKYAENFWGWLPRAVYAKGWEAKIEAEICGRIKRKLKEIGINVVQIMMRGGQTKLPKN
jgi:hypothetical protein